MANASELARRTAFAVVAIPVVLFLVYLGGFSLAILLAVFAAVGAWELYRLARHAQIDPLGWLGIPLAAVMPIAAALAPAGVFTLPPEWVATTTLLVVTVTIWARGVDRKPLLVIAVTLFGAMYTGGLLSFGYAIRYHPYAVGPVAGTVLVVLPVVLTWTTDIAAYAFGRAFGNAKLMPAVSPGKTIAGAIGGVAGAVVVCWVYVRYVLQPQAQLGLSPASVIVFAVVISVAAQVGDLAESLLKREAGVKDSSHLIPGHGGVLDRIDSLLFVLPVAYLFFAWPGFLLPVPV